MNSSKAGRLGLAGLVLMGLTTAVEVGAGEPREYRVLATNKTSTMEKELSEAAEAGYRFAAVMGGDRGDRGDEHQGQREEHRNGAGRDPGRERHGAPRFGWDAADVRDGHVAA